jgi:hypothetical protein
MSVSLLDAQLGPDRNLDAFVREDVAASNQHVPVSQWHAFLLQFMTPLKLRLLNLELLFLTVAFGPESEARCNWEQFSASSVTLEELDSSHYSIFPPLGRRLAAIAPEDGYVEKLRGHYRYTWTKNQLKLKELAGCITLLNENKIPSIVSKDVGISLVGHPECEARQINWLALLVSPKNYDRAQHLLSNTTVQLATYVPAKTGTLVWRDATPIELCGVKALSLSHADLLFQHLLSAKYAGTNQREWFADCLRLLPLFEREVELKKFRDRIESSCGVLDVLQAWSLFLRIADLTHCSVRSGEITESLASLRVSCKELFYRSGNCGRTRLKSIGG